MKLLGASGHVVVAFADRSAIAVTPGGSRIARDGDEARAFDLDYQTELHRRADQGSSIPDHDGTPAPE